jgi:TolB-like protein/tetratricopeptide (TPR) repeat protein
MIAQAFWPDMATQASVPAGAVFLSYASQDAEAAQRICAALRAAGIEVWLDQSELRGGDAWDRQIRTQINTCALFVPIISANSDARREGYFRREWRLSIERAGDMAEDVAFLLPVVIDGTSDAGARVPDRFREIHWSHLPAGEVSGEFIERVRRLLSVAQEHAPAVPASPPTVLGAAHGARQPVRGVSRPKVSLWAIIAVILIAASAYLAITHYWDSRHAAPPQALAFNPPAHSIAVLPFLNMSGDKEQEYFSDGLTEELLNSLAAVTELQVAARTSAFSFKGTNTDIGTIARRLNVGAVLEGSVRRSGNTVRITTQLINAVTGYHLWSHTYDRDLTDVLKLQTEIADAVAGALKVSLLGDVATKIELGGTRNPAAFDAYLRGQKMYMSAHGEKDVHAAIDAYTEAIDLDPAYAMAFANRSLALDAYSSFAAAAAVQGSADKSQEDALKAVALAPELPEGHLALAILFEGRLEFTRAMQEYDRALALGPGNARVLRDYGVFAVQMGRSATGIAAARRSVVLDPLNPASHGFLGGTLYFSRRNPEALAAYQGALALDPDHPVVHAWLGLINYALRDFDAARASCEIKTEYSMTQECLAMTYDKLGRHADAESMLAKLKAWGGDRAAYDYATIYAQWGNLPQALEWLDTALRLRDPSFERMQVDPLLDPLRQEPRFQAVMRELKFPAS